MSDKTFTAAMREQFSLPGETATQFMQQLKALDNSDKLYFHKILNAEGHTCSHPQGTT